MESLNNLVGILNNSNNFDINSNISLNKFICIDTSNQYLGINTLNPEYEIDVSNNGTIKTSKLIISDISRSNNSDGFNVGQIYCDLSGNLKIKINK